MGQITLCFNDIFSGYEDFKKFTDIFNLYDPQTEPLGEVLNQRIYYCLYNRYVGCGVAYETEDEFIAEFGIAYQEYFKLFMKKEEVIKKIHKLTEDDFLILAESLNNSAQAPNVMQSDPFELLDFTSLQTRSRAKNNKLIAYLNALRTLPDAQINYLIARFDYLWLDILPTENEYFNF